MIGWDEVLTLCLRDGARHVRRGCGLSGRQMAEGFMVGAAYGGQYSARIPVDGGYCAKAVWDGLGEAEREGRWSVGLGDVVVRGEAGEGEEMEALRARGFVVKEVLEAVGGLGRHVEVRGG